MALPHLRPRHDRPLYREVLAQAFRTAWEQKQYWPLALCASLLLTAGSYDVLLNAVSSIVTQSQLLNGGVPTDGVSLSVYAFMNGRAGIFEWMSGIQALVAMALVFLAFVILSCISQAGLVYAIGAIKRGKRPTLREAFRVGGGAFWPVAALNALSLATLWVLRFLVAFPLFLAITQQTPGLWFLYFLSFLLFVALSFVVILVHIFALNALVLQGAPIAEAILRGYQLCKRHWIVSVETAALLFLAAVCVSSGAFILFVIVMIPIFAALAFAMSSGSMLVFSIVTGAALAVFLVFGLCLAAFLTQLQYATWTVLFRRF